MKFPESQLAHQYLDGKKGIEIGPGAHNPFNIPNCIFVGKKPLQLFIDEELRFCAESQRLDVYCDADKLPFSDKTLEYVLSSHVIEHCWDVVSTINEWLRVLKHDGIIFMIIPHADRCCDIGREITTFNHLQNRIGTKCPHENDQAHHNVWRTEDFMAFCLDAGYNVIDYQDVDDKVSNGFTIVIKK